MAPGSPHPAGCRAVARSRFTPPRWPTWSMSSASPRGRAHLAPGMTSAVRIMRRQHWRLRVAVVLLTSLAGMRDRRQILGRERRTDGTDVADAGFAAPG